MSATPVRFSKLRACAIALIALIALFTLPNVSIRAQTPPPPPPGVDAKLDSARALRGERLRVSVITLGPGDLVWDRFGHDAIAIRDTVSGRNIAYNWGVYDWNSPNFLVRFLSGDTRYWMAGNETERMIQAYAEENRSVRIQVLALSPVERAALTDFIDWNMQEANKYYRYDYYQDNCTTRLRDAIDRLIRGQIKAATDTNTHPHTWRNETQRLTSTDLLVYSGINLALGQNADKPLTNWRDSFLPERFADAIAPLVVRDSTGRRYRLVASDTMRFVAQRTPMPLDPPDRTAMAALIGLTIAGIIAMLTDSRVRALRVLLAVGVFIWCLLGGILGTLLTLAGTVTKHAPYMGHNTTVLQINSLMLLAAYSVSAALYRARSTRYARATSMLIAALSLIGVICQFIPALSQNSGVVMAITVPINVMIAIAVLRVTNDRDVRQAAAAAALSRAA